MINDGHSFVKNLSIKKKNTEVLIDTGRREVDLEVNTSKIKYNPSTGGGQNDGNTMKLRNRICVGYIERTSVGSTEYSSIVYTLYCSCQYSSDCVE
jgi:predicted aspartyl protease